MNYEPDVACKGWNAVANSNEIAIPLSKKARQAHNTDTGPRGDQVFAYVVQFANERALSRNAQQRPEADRQRGSQAGR